MDIRISHRRDELIHKLRQCDNVELIERLIQQVDTDALSQARPITLLEYQKQSERALDDMKNNELFTEAEVRAFLKANEP